MSTKKSYLTHIGTAVPQYEISQRTLIDGFSQYAGLPVQSQKLIEKIYLGTQIDKRHSVLDFNQDLSQYLSASSYFSISQRMQWFEQYASALGILAVKNSGISADTLQSVTHLITVSCTGMYAPGIDVDIIKACHIPSTVARTCIYFMGCAAMINALKAADAIVRSQEARVLIVSVELCTLHFQAHGNDDQMVANALFGDGAACVLVQSKPVVGRKICLENFYSDLLTDTRDHMAWSIRNDGFLISLSAFVPALLASGVKELIVPLMDFYGVDLSEVDYFAIHPGGPKILHKIEEALCLPIEKNLAAHEILKNYGNMSSVTLLFIIQRILQGLEVDKAQTILGMAFGPGLSVESVLLKVS
jgi:alpha-pyrone synthase